MPEPLKTITFEVYCFATSKVSKILFNQSHFSSLGKGTRFNFVNVHTAVKIPLPSKLNICVPDSLYSLKRVLISCPIIYIVLVLHSASEDIINCCCWIKWIWIFCVNSYFLGPLYQLQLLLNIQTVRRYQFVLVCKNIYLRYNSYLQQSIILW